MMKRFIFIILPALVLSSCGNLVDGINQDPNNPTSASYSNILTGAEVGSIVLNTGETARRAGIFCGYYTGIDRQHEGFSNYSVTTSDFNSLWSDVYVDTYRNAVETEKAARAQGIGGITSGITEVIRALAIGQAAALYGDVPFAEAGDISIDNPAFEEQIAVYQSLQTLLDNAINNLQSGTGRPTSGSDIYFDGDATRWIETAYTLKARYYLHVRDYASAYAAAGSGISSPDHSMLAPHGPGQQENNLTYLFFAVEVRGADVVTSDLLTSLLQSDPASNPIPENYRGNAKTDETGRFHYYFLTNSIGVQPNTVDGFAHATASAPVVTYEENLLILAEAGARSQGFSTGLEHLNTYRAYLNSGGYMANALPATIRYEAYTSDDFANGGIENPDGLAADAALLREILEERYVTFFGQTEGFNDVRRTLGESQVRVPVMPNTGNQLPQRFLYAQSEIDRNDNIPDPIPGLFEPTDINQ